MSIELDAILLRDRLTQRYPLWFVVSFARLISCGSFCWRTPQRCSPTEGFRNLLSRSVQTWSPDSEGETNELKFIFPRNALLLNKEMYRCVRAPQKEKTRPARLSGQRYDLVRNDEHLPVKKTVSSNIISLCSLNTRQISESQMLYSMSLLSRWSAPPGGPSPVRRPRGQIPLLNPQKQYNIPL